MTGPRHSWRAAALALALALPGAMAFAQATPGGLWHSVDDKTGEVKGEIRIVERDGALSGRLQRSLRKVALETGTEFDAAAWGALEDAYRSALAAKGRAG